MFISSNQERNIISFIPEKRNNIPDRNIKSFENAYKKWFYDNDVLDKYPWLNLEFNNNEKKEISKILSMAGLVNGLNLSIGFNNFFQNWLSVEQNLENFYLNDDIIYSYSALIEKIDEEKKYKNEIFIGRDGLYMYYARRAYLLGHGRLDKKVSYLNLSRDLNYKFKTEKDKFFLDYLFSNTKLTTNDIEKNDFLFIDSGYEGSVLMSIIKFLKLQKEKVLVDYFWDNCLLLEGYNREYSFVDSVFVNSGGTDYCYATEKLEKPIYKVKNAIKDKREWKLEVYLKSERDIVKSLINKMIVLKHFYDYGKSTRNNFD